MAALHEALTSLSPVDWSEIPQDSLETYVEDILKAAELICSSVPPPPNGTSFAESTPVSTQANTASSHKDMHPSTARPLPPHEEYEELQGQWGKPMKFSSKENPLEVAVYKMAGKDRHGGWFARRSIHEGIGFSKFRDAMRREFAESLKVEGGPGAGCIRGIAADKSLEGHDVEGIGRVEVLQLSAQFPGPTTPREFVALLITSESALTQKSVASEGIASSSIPRHYVIVSRPVKYPDAPERSGYIRGQYESVELIREIPLHNASTKSTPNLPATAGQGAESKASSALKRSKSDYPNADEDGRELNPVEWIMITRSDPGGGIPRFMVDRGTPSTMISDVHKFLDWAAKSDATTSTNTPEIVTSKDVAQPSQSLQPTETVNGPPSEPKPASGILQQITQTLEAGLDAYAPTMISSFVHQRLDSQQLTDEASVSSDLSDTDSFTSATERRRTSVIGVMPGGSSESVSLASINAPSEAGDKKKLNSHEKKLLEISKEREKVERKLEKKRMEEEARLKKAQESEESEATKAQERYEKEMHKQEEKHRKELDKLEQKKDREAKKLEQKKQKQLERDAVHKLTRERDEFRSQVDLLRKENAILRERVEHFESSQVMSA
ncbi:hypothetical protein AMS68_001562 [Peltaster fructicola]|uniref:DUF3074 domain-containing protein n=1 Tax=Peltaster fructicola TaxID=286661 RepID=A0A6H0XN32_9PEZI|nr:hypothetical protein AMS68_001562 [Peltaster fructicola]